MDNLDDLREEYELDYERARPNRFADRFGLDVTVVVLEPEIAAAFPTEESVNQALRLVMELSAIPKAKSN